MISLMNLMRSWSCHAVVDVVLVVVELNWIVYFISTLRLFKLYIHKRLNTCINPYKETIYYVIKFICIYVGLHFIKYSLLSYWKQSLTQSCNHRLKSGRLQNSKSYTSHSLLFPRTSKNTSIFVITNKSTRIWTIYIYIYKYI